MGVWKVLPNGIRDLVEPSEQWKERLKEMEDERVLETLRPSPEEMYNADFEIRMITLLFEMEVI